MWEDPIVAEVHRIRKEIAAKYNFDMAAYFADVQRRQVALGDRLVRQKKRSDSEPDRGGANGPSGSTFRQPPRRVS
jgi:hypothetical protein